jgi:hypothetical protein
LSRAGRLSAGNGGVSFEPGCVMMTRSVLELGGIFRTWASPLRLSVVVPEPEQPSKARLSRRKKMTCIDVLLSQPVSFRP